MESPSPKDELGFRCKSSRTLNITLNNKSNNKNPFPVRRPNLINQKKELVVL